MIMVNFHRAVIGQHGAGVSLFFLGDLALSAPPESFYSKRFQAIPEYCNRLCLLCVCLSMSICNFLLPGIYSLAVGCSSHLPVFDIFHIFYSNHTVVPFFGGSHVSKMTFFGLRGTKKCHFLVCGVRKKWKSWKSSERVGNEVKSFTVLVGNLPHIMP